jgi:DNA polymerase
VETDVTDILDLDIETYSTVDLPKSNVYAYVEDPEFQILMCGWSFNDSPVEVYDSYEEFQDRLNEIPGLWDPEVRKVAHNAGFERVCFSRYAGMPVGEYLPPEHWFDTAAVAALRGLPRGLDALALALKVTPKDSAGTRLINLFCQPYRGRRVLPHQKPEQWEEFRRYCGQDVGTMQEIRHAMPGWPADGVERDMWYLDQRINDRGMRVDLDLAEGATETAHANNERLSSAPSRTPRPPAR